MRINLHYPRNSVVVSRRLFTKRGQGCVGNCGVRWKKGNVGSKCGEPWNDIEFQSLLYQRPKVVTKPKEQSFKKRFSKSYVHAWVKKNIWFSRLEDMEAIPFEPLCPRKKDCDWKTFTYSICAFPVRYFSLWRWGAGIQMRAPFPLHDPTSHHWKIATLLRQNWLYFGVASTDWLVQSTWSDLTEYTLIIIPKTGDELGPTSWRPIAIPIAILQITGKILTKLLHQCLKECFESSQSHDQLGFRPGMGVEHALLIFESVTEKSLEFGLGLWMATLDLRKDTKGLWHFAALFAALHGQGPTETASFSY